MPMLDVRDWVVVDALDEAKRTKDYAGVASRLRVPETTLRRALERHPEINRTAVVKARETMIANTEIGLDDTTSEELLERIETLEGKLLRAESRLNLAMTQIDSLMRMVRHYSPDNPPVPMATHYPVPHIELAMKAVTTAFGVTAAEIIGAKRGQRIVRARHAFCALAYANGAVKITTVARYINRDHSTALHGVETHVMRLQANEVYKHEWNEATRYYNALAKGEESLKSAAANADGVGKEAV